jgi:hypothetical protein
LKWAVQWGDKIERLMAMQAKGQRVPALDNRPGLPAHLLPAFDCIVDLSIDAAWRDVRDWCAHYGQDLDDLWPLVRSMRGEMRRWQASRSPPAAPAPAPSKKK